MCEKSREKNLARKNKTRDKNLCTAFLFFCIDLMTPDSQSNRFTTDSNITTEHAIVIHTDDLHVDSPFPIQLLAFVSVAYDLAIAISAFMICDHYQNDECLSHFKSLIQYSSWLLWVGIMHIITIVIRGVCIYESVVGKKSVIFRFIQFVRLYIMWMVWVIGLVLFASYIAVYCEGPLYEFALAYIVLQAIVLVIECVWWWKSSRD